VLWRADRPATCTGHALSRAGDRAIAVLTDLTERDGELQTTAAGYDLRTGRPLWGPIAVRGSTQAPGLLFAAPAPAAALGATGPRSALDPATGRLVADESRSPGIRVIGEYDGTVVTADATSLQATDTATGGSLWRVQNPAGLHAVAPAGARTPPGALLVGSGPGSAGRLIDLRTGSVLAEGVRAAGFDELSATWIVLGVDRLTGVGADTPPWSREVPPGSRLMATGSGLVYTVADHVGRVFNSVTGKDAGAYPPEVSARFAVPQVISPGGAAVFRIDGAVVLATAGS
jgi:hypothetical protein